MHGDEVAEGDELCGQVGACEGHLGPTGLYCLQQYLTASSVMTRLHMERRKWGREMIRVTYYFFNFLAFKHHRKEKKMI